jgi:hypothetical protein
MMSMTKTPNTVESTPTLEALELRGFAEGVQTLAALIETGQDEDATKEQITAAEQAAQSVLRNAPSAVRIIRRLEGFADQAVERATARRDVIMTSMFGPDDA